VQELGILRVRTYKSIVFYVMITQTMNLLDLLSWFHCFADLLLFFFLSVTVTFP
jgi:hypothetical protein